MPRPMFQPPRILRLAAALVIVMLPKIGAADELMDVSPEGVKAILATPGLQITGATRPDVTVVEYFDYNCPFCKRMVPTFAQLLATDKKIAVVYKDWPVLGEVSVHAARCALAAQWQGKYLVAHDALLSGPRLSSDETVEAVLAHAGIDVVRLKRDLDTHSKEIGELLSRNAAEAQALELQGTPGIMIGSQLMPGGAELPFIQKLIADARSAAR